MKKNFWTILFYFCVIIDLFISGIIVFLFKKEVLTQNVAKMMGGGTLSVLFFLFFLFSYFKEEACIHGSITVKKSTNPSLYWFMVFFWVLSAIITFGYALCLSILTWL